MNARYRRWIEFLQDYTFTLPHKVRVKNKAAGAPIHHIFILTKMTTVNNDFERLRIEYESYPDFHEIYMDLKDGITQVDGFILHDGYLFLGRKLCIPRTFLREFLI